MRLLALLATFSLLAFLQAQENLNLLSNSQIADRIRSETDPKEQTRLVWVLVTRTVAGDDAAWKLARPFAERLKTDDDLNYRALFAFGFCRGKEAFDTRDPILKRRRIDEGRRAMTTAQQVGARDSQFLLDSGVAMAALPTEIDLHRECLNSLTLARREMGNKFAELTALGRCEWYWAMGTGFARFGLNELAQDHYQTAFELAPDSYFGKTAINWVRSRGG